MWGTDRFIYTTYCHPSAYTLRMNSIAQGFESILHFCAAITVQFEQDTYMVDESDGMIDVKVATSGRTSFEYTFTVTPMDLTATSKLDGFYTVYVYAEVGMATMYCEDVTYAIKHSLSLFCADNIDYTYSPTPYVFGPTDANEPIPSLVLPIPINDDNNNELNESFKLTLEVSADGRAANVTEGSISMTVVLIKDDDGKLNNTVQTQRYISAYFALCGSMRG